jgi:hypothetical protein
LEEFDQSNDQRPSAIVPAQRDEPRPAPPLTDTTPDHTLLVGLESALHRRDAQEAARLYIRASATGVLPFGNSERMLARLFNVALGDARFDPGEFCTLARAFGWDRPQLDSAVVSDVRERVFARLAAEDWYDHLSAIAASRQRLGRKWVRAARLVLGRIRGWGLFRIHRPTLQRILDEYARHETWLCDRIDNAWVATLKRRMRRRELFASAGIALFLGAIFVDGAIVSVNSSKGDSAVAFLSMIPLGLFLLWFIRLMLRHFVDVWRRRP